MSAGSALKLLLGGALLVLYAVASHTLFTQVERYARIAVLWIWLPLAAGGVLMAWRTRGRWIVFVLMLAATLFIWQATADMRLDPGVIFMIQYLAIQTGLAALFGVTLRAGQVPLVTRLATVVHGRLPPEIDRYTRTVTLTWTLFFILLGGVATALYLLADRHWWSVWVNFATPVLIGALFVVEYAVRRRSFPDFEHSSFSTAFRAFQNDLDRRKVD